MFIEQTPTKIPAIASYLVEGKAIAGKKLLFQVILRISLKLKTYQWGKLHPYLTTDVRVGKSKTYLN